MRRCSVLGVLLVVGAVVCGLRPAPLTAPGGEVPEGPRDPGVAGVAGGGRLRAADGVRSAEPGGVLWQSLRYSAVTTQAAPDAPAAAMRIEFTGRLASWIVAASADGTVRECHVVVDCIQVTGSDGGDGGEFGPDLVRGLRDGFLLRQSVRGDALAIRVPQNALLPCRTLSADLARSLTFSVEDAATWTMQRDLGACTELIRCERRGGECGFVARRAGFAAVAGPAALPQGELASHVQWDRAANWPLAVDLNDRQRWDFGVMLVSLDKTIVLALATDAALPTFGAPAFEAGWQRLDCADAIAAANAAAERAAAAADPRTVGQLAAELVRALQCEASGHAADALFRLLVLRLQAMPAAALDLARLLREGAVDDLAFARLSEAIARSNTMAAEQAMQDLLADDGLPSARRCTLVANCLLFDHAVPGVADSLFQMHRGGGDAEAADMALLAAGALARFPAAGAARQSLIAARPADSEPSALSSWLRAVGNAGGESSALAIPCLDHPSAVVRLAAVDAVGASPDDALVASARRLASDPSTMVRASVARLLAARGSTSAPELVAAVNDSAPKVRLALVRGLGARVADPGANSLLRQLANGDGDEAVRNAARRALARN